MMKLTDLIVLFTIFIVLALYTVYQQLETVRLGYRIAELQKMKAELAENERTLEYEVSKAGAPARILARAAQLELELVLSEGWNVLVAGRDRPQRPSSVARR